jgi:hypothetical protein
LAAFLPALPFHVIRLAPVFARPATDAILLPPWSTSSVTLASRVAT